MGQTNAEYSPEHLKHERGQLHVVEDPCQNTFKDEPAFIKRLIKVLAAKNLFLLHSYIYGWI